MNTAITQPSTPAATVPGAAAPRAEAAAADGAPSFAATLDQSSRALESEPPVDEAPAAPLRAKPASGRAGSAKEMPLDATLAALLAMAGPPPARTALRAGGEHAQPTKTGAATTRQGAAPSALVAPAQAAAGGGGTPLALRPGERARQRGLEDGIGAQGHLHGTDPVAPGAVPGLAQDDPALPAGLLARRLADGTAVEASAASPPVSETRGATSAAAALSGTELAAAAARPAAPASATPPPREAPGRNARDAAAARPAAGAATTGDEAALAAAPQAVPEHFHMTDREPFGRDSQDTGAAPPPGAAAAMAAGAAPALATGVAGAPATAAPTDRVAEPVGSSQWGAALGQQLVRLLPGGGREVELHLHPADLGPLKVTLSLTDSHAQLMFVADHAAVRQALEAALPQLRSTLADSGISLGQASVGSGTGQSAADAGQGGQHRSAPPAAPGFGADAPRPHQDRAPAARHRAGGVDTFA